jgi:hypothetical protein
MNRVPNFELLKYAYAVIDGIPENRFNLSVIAQNNAIRVQNNPHHCGTIGCALGWLAMHPDFQARGLSIDPKGYLCFEGNRCGVSRAGVGLFGITWQQSEFLFFPPREGERGNDKEVFQRRVKEFFASISRRIQWT